VLLKFGIRLAKVVSLHVASGAKTRMNDSEEHLRLISGAGVLNGFSIITHSGKEAGNEFIYEPDILFRIRDRRFFVKCREKIFPLFNEKY